MTQMQPLTFEVNAGELTYGGGLLRLYYPSPPSTSPADHYLVPILPIEVPPAAPGTFPPGGDDGSGWKPFWPIGCGKIGCMTCITTPCVVPHRRPPPKPHETSGTLALAKALSFGVQEAHAAGAGPLLLIRNANDTADIKAQLEAWVANQLTNTTFHVFALALESVPGLTMLPPYIAVPVVPAVTDDLTKTLAQFFSEP